MATFGAGNLAVDPLFCGPLSCDAAPTSGGVYDVDAASVVLDVPECGAIGEGGAGCAVVAAGTVAGPPGRALFADPNPFEASTTIRYTLPEAARVKLAVYDVAGRAVRRLHEGPREAGVHRVRWDGTDDAGARLASGIYFVRISADHHRLNRRLVLRR